MKSTTDDRSALETSKRVREASALLLLALAGYFFLSLWGYDADDPSWANARDSSLVSNWGGIVGAWLAYTLYFAFGHIAVVLSLFATISAIFIFRRWLISCAGPTCGRDKQRNQKVARK